MSTTLDTSAVHLDVETALDYALDDILILELIDEVSEFVGDDYDESTG